MSYIIRAISITVAVVVYIDICRNSAIYIKSKVGFWRIRVGNVRVSHQ